MIQDFESICGQKAFLHICGVDALQWMRHSSPWWWSKLYRHWLTPPCESLPWELNLPYLPYFSSLFSPWVCNCSLFWKFSLHFFLLFSAQVIFTHSPEITRAHWLFLENSVSTYYCEMKGGSLNMMNYDWSTVSRLLKQNSFSNAYNFKETAA